jgi:hypothetical protein
MTQTQCEGCSWVGIRRQATVRCRICGACFCDECKKLHAALMDWAPMEEVRNDQDHSINR